MSKHNEKNAAGAGHSAAENVQETPGAENVQSDTVAETSNDDAAPGDEGDKPEAVVEAAATTAAPAAVAPKPIVLPENLLPTAPTAEAVQKAAKKVIDRFGGMNLKDFDSIRIRKAQAGDLDFLNNPIPLDQDVFVVRKKDTPLTELKAMPLDYHLENIMGKDAEQNDIVVGTRLYGYKVPKIRKAINDGKKIAGEIHPRYKQHTVVVASPSTNGVLNPDGTTMIIGAVAYWDSELTEADVNYEKQKAEQKKADEAKKEADRMQKKQEAEEKKKLDATLAAQQATAAAAKATATPATDKDDALSQKSDATQPAEASKQKVS